MKAVKPVTITDSNLTTTNVAENDYAVYNAGTTYNTGDRVILTTGYHKVYESLIDSNTGNNPPDNLTGTTPPWLEVGATNAWKMFDEITNSFTTNSGSIEIDITPGGVNTVACLGVSAATVTVTMTNGVDTVYTSTQNMQDAVATNWYEYFFEPITRKTTAIFTDLPVYSTASINVDIDNASDDAVCGTFVTGQFQDLGDSLWGAKASILDFSKKTTDAFGNITILKRNNLQTLEIDVDVPINKTNNTYKFLRDNVSEPVLWIGFEDYDPTAVYGFAQEFNQVYSSPAGATLSLRIEGLI